MMRQEKLDSIRKSYPALELLSAAGELDSSLVWEGWLQPIQSCTDLSPILDDIENDRAVIISKDGEVLHDPQCQYAHSEHRLLSKLSSPNRLFKIRVEDFCSNQQPYARLLEPEVLTENRRHILGTNGICAFEPWTFPWDANSSSIVEFVDQCVLWLIKWSVFSQTNEWIGSETPHDAKFLFETILPNQNCHCGSGKRYGMCHRNINGTTLFGKSWVHVDRWLESHNSSIQRFQIRLPKRGKKLYEQSRAKAAF